MEGGEATFRSPWWRYFLWITRIFRRPSWLGSAAEKSSKVAPMFEFFRPPAMWRCTWRRNFHRRTCEAAS